MVRLCIGSETRLSPVFISGSVFFLLVLALSAGDPDVNRVAVLANASDQDSVNLATYYARARNIPSRNVIFLHTPKTEEISWTAFSKEILNRS